MKLRLFAIVCLLLLSLHNVSLCKTDKEEEIIVYAVKVSGNNVTRTKFILREMTLKPGMKLDYESIERDRLRLESLGLFNRVSIIAVADAGRALLLVEVTEPWYFFVFPVAKIDPYKPDRYLYGGKIHRKNFSGYGDNITVTAWDGYERGILLTHKDPWFRFADKYGIDGTIFLTDKELKFGSEYVYRQEVQYYEITVRRRIDYFERVALSLAWEERSSELELYTISPGTTDQLLVTKLFLRHDQRNYRYYPTKGFLFQITAEGNQVLNHNHNFVRETFDYRRYFPLGSTIIAGRLTTSFSHGKTPYYRQVTLSREQVRSDYNFAPYGEIAVSANLEFRFPIIKFRYFNLDKIPLAGKYLMNLKFSTEGVLYVDKGFGQHRGDVLVKHDLWAYGCGFQFQLPYVQIAHVLFGWKPDDTIGSPFVMLRTGVTF